ncbi:MAG TPA: DNA integrity scanning protein DisA nucleotide-binding domain protein [Candidatus Izemoplasmatales bacterium]|nr:DNA integrity scanning protein DisA nucleotide-binding domain protein [Candidatus Izemoplasmatales bacterium]
MDFFVPAVIATYLYAIFLLLLRTKVAHKTTRPAKVFLIVFFALDLFLLFKDMQTGYELAAEILMIIPVPYILVMVYLNEIKLLIKKIGILHKKTRNPMINNELADKLLDTVDFLSNRKVGALITIERNVDLSVFISKALMINAPVSSELLASIFITTTPLHDGAVIIRNNQILCAKAYYPSTDRTDLPLHFGTRHRAAIGISEQSDALTIVVSEETGHVSVAINRQLDYNVSRETLSLYFEKYLRIN